MLKIAKQLIETHRSKDGQQSTDSDKLNLVDILLAQQGAEKLSDGALSAVLFVSTATALPCNGHSS